MCATTSPKECVPTCGNTDTSGPQFSCSDQCIQLNTFTNTFSTNSCATYVLQILSQIPPQGVNVKFLGNFNPTYLFLFSVASGSVIIQEKEEEKNKEKEKEKGGGTWQKKEEEKEQEKEEREEQDRENVFWGEKDSAETKSKD